MTRTRFRWSIAACVLVGIALLAWLYRNPFVLVDAGVNGYLCAHRVHQRNVLVDEQRIHYLEAGRGSRVLVLVHGLGARASDWGRMIPPLANAGYHVYAPDLLGYGSSAHPADGDYSIEHEADVVCGFMDAVHVQRADLAGWSMGGWVSTLIALDHPERVERLVLYDNAGMYQQVDFPVTMFAPENRSELNELLARLEPDHPRLHIPAFAVYGIMRKLQANADVVDASLASMLDGRAVLDFRIMHLRMPVLIVWGTQDHLLPIADGMREHELIPDSEFVRMEGCGHLLVAECPKPVAQVTASFLKQTAPKRGELNVLNADQ